MNEMSFKRTTEALTELLAWHTPCHSSWKPWETK